MARKLSTLVTTAAIAGAVAFAALPAHAGGVSWNVSIGLPGFGLYAGQPWGGWRARSFVQPWAPAPVVVAPPVVYRPAFRPYERPVQVYRPRPFVVYRHW